MSCCTSSFCALFRSKNWDARLICARDMRSRVIFDIRLCREFIEKDSQSRARLASLID